MANVLRKLASDTVIYGLSTILARVINFVFVPMYTRLLTTDSYGTVAEFMSYIAVLQVVLVLGLETGCFRFSSRDGVDPDKVFSNAVTAVLCVSGLFFLSTVIFASPIASALGYAGYEACIKYVGGILLLDSVTAIFFARLRYEGKALKFAVFKTIKILTETLSNILLFFVFPAYAAAHPGSLLLDFVPATPDFSYVIFAIFISCIVCTLLFVPMMLKQKFMVEGKLMRQMLVYSLPLMIAALPGILNELLDRLLFRYFDTSSEAWRSSLGIYQAAVKLSVIMSLCVQMFRYAAEPFFFQQEKEGEGKGVLYAKVLDYSTAFFGLVFLGVSLYVDVLALILGPEFREGVDVIPLMLGGYMLLGMQFNVSMWYKLSGRTSMAIYITLSGLAVTAIVNILFMPAYSYFASAWAHLASCLVMFVISAALGHKYYPIPYNWGRIASIVGTMVVLYLLARWTDTFLPVSDGAIDWLKAAVHTIFIFLYAGAMYVILGRPAISAGFFRKK